MISSAEMLVMGDEVIGMVKHFIQGIEVNADTIARGIIEKIGPGGTFLPEDHPMNHFREVWYPQIFDRMMHDAWLEQGVKDFEERLQEKTKKMMGHRPNPLPAEIPKELDRMAKHWK